MVRKRAIENGFDRRGRKRPQRVGMSPLVPCSFCSHCLCLQENASLPFLTTPRDPLRDGLITLKDGVLASHPVEIIQSSMHSSKTSKTEMLSSVYGSALPARMQIEQQLLNRIERLPGLPSSKLGLDATTGDLDDFSFASYLNLPEDFESEPTATMHTVMEKKLGLTK